MEIGTHFLGEEIKVDAKNLKSMVIFESISLMTCNNALF